MNRPIARVLILGSRGVPAAHGGFETLAHHLALYLVERGWDVTVYCQIEGRGLLSEDDWNGVRRVLVPVQADGAVGTVLFDWRSTVDALRRRGIPLVLGYNTALFSYMLRVLGRRRLVMNMDGIEWKREKWSRWARVWLRLNERIGTHAAHTMIADHPEIEKHLRRLAPRARIATIPYGAKYVAKGSTEALVDFGLSPGTYFLLVARLEPENSVLTVVQAHTRTQTNVPLVVVGPISPERNRYHERLVNLARESDIRFVGPIYDQDRLAALRLHALAYVHGHTVGGTNPSLIEAMGAGNAIIAHDNRFNRWVAGESARYFSDAAELAVAFDELASLNSNVDEMRAGSRARFFEAFTWPTILKRYERLLAEHSGSVRDRA